jgi:hypothetical protein
MFRKCRKVVAVTVACVFITGIAAYAQTVQRAKGQSPPARQQAMQQRQDATAAPEGRFQKQAQARMGSLQALLAPPDPALVQRLAERLGLSDQQKEQIKQLYVQFISTVRPIREQRRAALKEFMTAFKNPSVTKTELQSLSEPILEADKAILDAEFDFWLAFRPILNVQQQAQMQQFMLQKADQEFGDVRGGGHAPRTRENPAVPGK